MTYLPKKRPPVAQNDDVSHHQGFRNETPKPFAEAAHALRRYGLTPIPTGGEDGKSPLVKWPKRPYGERALSGLVAKHGSAHVGILCDLSGVTIVDIDDPALLPAMLERFGETPLQTQTPSGGVHLWYRANGEGNAQRLDGLAVDIRGERGFVVVPPSVRPSGPHAGKPYAFLRGGWDDLPRLPQVKPGSLTPRLRRGGVAEAGARNSTLFAALLKAARACDDQETLIDVAQTINADFMPPLGEAEVLKTAISAWGYEQRGENWSGTGARVIVTEGDYSLLSGNPDALDLLIKLRFAHRARSEPFAISAKPMAREKVIPGWGPERYRKARKVLIEKGFLQCLFAGGKSQHSPSLYCFESHPQNRTKDRPAPPVWKPPVQALGSRGSETKPLTRGAETEPNITKHPPPLGGSPTGTPAGDLFATGIAENNGDDDLTFGEVIRQARKAQGLTQQQVAQRVGLSRSSYGNIETGTYRPSPSTTIALKNILRLRHFCNALKKKPPKR